MIFYYPILSFGVEREATVGGTRRRANIVVTNHNMNATRKTIFIEAKRPPPALVPMQTIPVNSAIWQIPLNQLERYMLSSRDFEPNVQNMYGLVDG
jgi:hypothetical protein